MKCKHVRQKIDQFLIEKKGLLMKKANQHISECHSCREHYELTLQVSKLTDKLSIPEPLLTESSKLTENIMLGINQVSQEKSTHISISFVTSINLQRLLAAASICLLFIFGYEQYNVLAKINRLENQTQAISRNFQTESANLNGSLEGFLLIKYNFLKKNAPEYFNNIKLDQYSKQEIMASLNQLGVSSLSIYELKQYVESNSASFDNSRMDAIPGSLLQFKN